jgi:hypothetical protein
MITARTPMVGDIVHYFPGDSMHGGMLAHPAIVTRVIANTCVNLWVISDSSLPAMRPATMQVAVRVGVRTEAGWVLAAETVIRRKKAPTRRPGV